MADGAGSTLGGTYTLLVELDVPASVRFGALGPRDLAAGYYAYTGSALGPGGFARIERHGEVASGERDVRHWHVDSLLGHDVSRLDGDVRSPGLGAECEVARAIATADGLEAVPAVGASDCDCDSHLAFAPDRSRLLGAVRRAHRRSRSRAEDPSAPG